MASVRAAVIALCTLLFAAAPAVAQSSNAAPLYRQAFAALGREPYGKRENAIITPEDETFLSSLGSVLSAADRDRVNVILMKAGPALAQLTEASRARKCDWELDRSQGFSMLLPHLSAMRSAGWLLRVQALAAVNDVDKTATVESLASIGRMGVHAGQDQVAISSLVGAAVGSVFTDMSTLAIEGGAVDEKNAQQLLDAMGPLKGSDPFAFAAAVRGEYGSVKAQLAQANGAAALREALGDSEQARALAGMTPEALRAELAQAKPLYERAAVAFENPDPMAARAEIKRIEQFVESGKGGKLLQAVMMSLGQLYESKLKSEQNLALLTARLQALADGKTAAKELQNAAILLARAAAAAAAVGGEGQDAIEMLRVAPSALDAAGAARAAELLVRAQDNVFARLAQAAELKRCNFSILRLREPSLDTRLLGGLRAATRMALAQGLQSARAQRQSSPCVPALIVAFRASALLATDPTLARAHVAQSIWNEAAAALQEALQFGPLAPLAKEELERALATMTPADPFGWRKGFDSDVHRMVEEMRRWQPGAAAPEAVEMRHQILKSRGPTSGLARVGLCVARRGDDDHFPGAEDAVLVRLTDLWPESGVEAVRAARKAVKEADAATGGGAMEQSIFDVRFDLPLDEQKSLFRKHDPVRGVVLADEVTAQGESGAIYTKPFDLLK